MLAWPGRGLKERRRFPVALGNSRPKPGQQDHGEAEDDQCREGGQGFRPRYIVKALNAGQWLLFRQGAG